MRYDVNNLDTMQQRLAYLVENFSLAQDRGDAALYVGPKVTDARQLRPQDFVPISLAAIHFNKLTDDLVAKARENGAIESVMSTLKEAANVVGSYPASQDMTTLMQYKM